jgi:hypothetical protein
MNLGRWLRGTQLGYLSFDHQQNRLARLLKMSDKLQFVGGFESIYIQDPDKLKFVGHLKTKLSGDS